MKNGSSDLRGLTDDALLARVADLVGRSRRVEAELVAHLAEVDARRLYLREACPSMHVYATQRLHLSDAEAYLRITAARLSRRFPPVLAMLADGKLHLSGIAKLSPHLTDENSEEVLRGAAHLSKRAIELLVAGLAPRPDVRSLIRRLPAATPAAELRPDGGQPIGETASAASAAASSERPGSTASSPGTHVLSPEPRAVIAPLAPSRYRVQFTAGADLQEKLVRAQALLRHQVPDGDLAAIVDRAMSLLLRELERARFAATANPRKSAGEADPTPSSRRIPDPIRREVWQRDGGQCTFRDQQGRRCGARERIQFHHEVPFGRGGDHGAGNVRLLCAMHNHFQAKLDYGADFMARRSRSPRQPAAP